MSFINPFDKTSFLDKPVSQLGLPGKLAQASQAINTWLGMSSQVPQDFTLRQARDSQDTSPLSPLRGLQSIFNAPVGFTAGSLGTIFNRQLSPEAQSLARQDGESFGTTLSRLPEYLKATIKPKEILSGGWKGIVEKQQPSQVLPEPIGMGGELVGRLPQLMAAQGLASTLGKASPLIQSLKAAPYAPYIYSNPAKQFLMQQGARIAGLATEGVAGSIFGAMQPSQDASQLAKNVGSNALGFLPFGMVTPGMSLPAKVATLTAGLGATRSIQEGNVKPEYFAQSLPLAVLGSLGGPKSRGKAKFEGQAGPTVEGEVVGEATKPTGRSIIPGVSLKAPTVESPVVPARPFVSPFTPQVWNKGDMFKSGDKTYRVAQPYSNGSVIATEIVGGQPAFISESWQPDSLKGVTPIKTIVSTEAGFSQEAPFAALLKKTSGQLPDNEYVYHTTSPKSLESIATGGLKPATGMYGKGVYFSPNPELTGGFGSPEGAMIRVKRTDLPKDFQQLAEQGWTGDTVSPRNMEVSLDKGKSWKPISPGPEVINISSPTQATKGVPSQLEIGKPIVSTANNEGKVIPVNYKDGNLTIHELQNGEIGISNVNVINKDAGTGTEMINETLNYIKEKYPNKNITLFPEGERNIQFYKKLGFSEPVNGKMIYNQPSGGVLEGGKWFRGVDQTNANGDKFFSTDKNVAGDFGKVNKINPSELPKNPLVVNSKDELAQVIGYKGDPMAEPKLPIEQRFDTLAKDYALSKGNDGIVYENGTFDTPELHVFSPQPEGGVRGVPKELDPKVAQSLREAKGLSASDITKKYPDINLKKDVPVTDIHGNKSIIPEGEALTPYELKGNKVLLQDGETYIVSKNQFQNIKGNAVSGEAKPFAPELNGTEETVKGTEKDAYDKYIEQLMKKYGVKKGELMDVITDAEDTKLDKLSKDAPDKTTFSQYQLPGGKNYKEVLIKAPRNEALSKKPMFKSSHWDEPNVISHLRLNERTYKGKKVTFVEEIQSDWAREARKGSNATELPDRVRQPNAFGNLSVTPHPLLKNWQELSIKRALKEAVANDSDYFAWINGEQTSARYNLATYLEDVKWKDGVIKLNTKNGDVKIIPYNDKGIILEKDSSMPSDWAGKKLDEVIGKGLADKIMAEEKGTLSGEGLKFGGEWANNLYNKQIKNIVEDLTGGKVETLDMGLPTDTKNIQFFIDHPTKNATDLQMLTNNQLKVGQQVVKRYDQTAVNRSEPYIITDVLGDGKFKAMPKIHADRIMKDADFYGENIKEKLADSIKQGFAFDQWVEIFDISTKKSSGQQAIKLTPEIKAIIKGEVPTLKQPSGVLPFEGTATRGIETKDLGKKSSVSQLEKLDTEEAIHSFLVNSKNQEDFVKRIKLLENQLDNPENAVNTKKLTNIGRVITKELHSLVGAEGTGSWQQDYYLFQSLKEDPTIKPQVDAMERLLDKINSISPRTIRHAEDKSMRVNPEVSEMVSDTAYLPRDKYMKANTQNDLWVKGNLAFYRMGNKRGMLGYIFNALGVENKDVQSITPEQIQHLSGVSNVEDLFGGSGLLSVLSRSLFPSAKITYNEYSPEGRAIITEVKDNPKELEKSLSIIHQYIRYNPTADWFAHFRSADPELYKSPSFKAAMLLVEANRGRSLKIFVDKTLSAIPGDPIMNTIHALPKYSEHMNYFDVTYGDAFKKIDKYIESGTPSDFLWIDPPYLWATGSGTGSEFESAQGFINLLGKLEKLNDRGVKFVFFNTDPQSKLDDILKIPQGELNKLPEIEKMLDEMTKKLVVIRNIHPINAQGGRTEVVITNISSGVDKGSLVSVGSVRTRLADIQSQPRPSETFHGEDVPITTQIKVTEKRTSREAIAEEKRKLAEEKTLARAKAKETGQPITFMEKLNAALKIMREATNAAGEANRITDWQIRTIRTLRSRASVRNDELTRIMDEILQVDSLSKLMKHQASELIELLQPKNWDRLIPELKAARKEIEEEKLATLSEEPRADNPALKELEGKYGVINDIHKTRAEIKDLADRIRHLPEYKKKGEAPLAALLPFLPESAASKIAGMQTEFQIPMRNIINISNILSHRLNLGIKSIFKDLSPVEVENVMKIQSEAMRYSAGTPRERQYANYLQAVFGSHLALVNNVRTAAGLSTLNPLKRYIPFIIDENLKEAVGAFDKSQFNKQRLKTAKEFLAGMFTHDPERIADIFSSSAGDYLKRDLYKALLSGRLDQLKEISDTAYTYGKALVDTDIFRLADANRKFAAISGEAINERVGKLFPKRIKVTPEFANAVMNTHWADELKDSVSKGYLEIPRIQIPNIPNLAISVVYPLKLSWNLAFGLLNRTQPAHGIPFVGTRNFVRSRLKLYSLVFPWNKEVRKRYFKILAEGGYEYGRFVGGDELEFHNKAINFVSDLTELMNRTESMLQGETYIGQMEKTLGMALSETDKQRVMAAFSNFINYLSGKGYSPLAQRSTMGKAFYVFNQYPLNILVTYTEMAKMAMKDHGAKEFWRLMGEEGGASEKSYEFFNKLPKGSKINVFRIFLAIALPVATLYAFSQSWDIAKRALPGWPKVTSPIIDFAKAVADYIDDPERAGGALVTAFKKTFSLTAWDRLETALGGSFKVGSKEVTFSPDQAWKALIWGKTATPEYADYQQKLKDKKEQNKLEKDLPSLKSGDGFKSPFDSGSSKGFVSPF